jgi:hypothetical protein
MYEFNGSRMFPTEEQEVEVEALPEVSPHKIGAGISGK